MQPGYWKSCTVPVMVLLVLGSSSLSAQEPGGDLLAGPAVGVGFGMDRARIPVFPGVECGGDFLSGSTFEAKGGISAVGRSLFSNDLGLHVGLYGVLHRGRLAVAPLNATHIYDDETERVVALERQYRLELDEWEIRLDARLRYQVSERLWLAIGPSLGYGLAGTIEQSDNILGPEGFSFPDGLREHAMTAATGRSAPRFGLDASVGTLLPVGRNLYLAPSISLGADLLSRSDERSWRSIRAGGELALLFDLTSPPAESIPLPVPRSPAALAAQLELLGVASDGSTASVAMVSAREVFFRRHTPLVPALFFDRNSDLIPSRYVALDRSATGGFSADSLGSLEPLQVQNHILDIVGERMRQRPERRLELHGMSSVDEPEELRAARRAVIQKYLTDIWSIDPARIGAGAGDGAFQQSTQTTADGRADNRRVEFNGSDRSLLAPVVSSRIIQEFDPPQLRLMPRITAAAGVRRWSIVIRQGDLERARYSSQESGPLGEVNWRIVYDRNDSLLKPIVAELEVIDSAGSIITTRSEVPLRRMTSRRVDGEQEQQGDRERASYVLVAFDFDSPDLGGQNESQISDIVSTVVPGARITITGYTDRIGNQQHNRDLSLQRAERVGAEIERRLRERQVAGTTITIEGAGPELSRFENDLPEGRFLSRGVSVVIDQGAQR